MIERRDRVESCGDRVFQSRGVVIGAVGVEAHIEQGHQVGRELGLTVQNIVEISNGERHRQTTPIHAIRPQDPDFPM